MKNKGGVQDDWIGYADKLMRYHLHIDTDTLSDEKWAQTFKHLVDIRKQEMKS